MQGKVLAKLRSSTRLISRKHPTPRAWHAYLERKYGGERKVGERKRGGEGCTRGGQSWLVGLAGGGRPTRGEGEVREGEGGDGGVVKVVVIIVSVVWWC